MYKSGQIIPGASRDAGPRFRNLASELFAALVRVEVDYENELRAIFFMGELPLYLNQFVHDDLDQTTDAWFVREFNSLPASLRRGYGRLNDFLADELSKKGFVFQ